MNRDGGSRTRWTGEPARVGASGGAAINYREALAWLYSLQRFGIKLGLENIQRLIAELTRSGGLQTADYVNGGLEAAAPWGRKVIHVAGTNGKGSVCAMIDSICRAQKYRTGLFTSPHLVTFRERVRVNGEMISETDAANGLTILRELVRDWDPHPTFFEIVTALALKHFSDAKADIVILETGLGGRLDATNAVQSNGSVITPIDLDHEEWLGSTIREIASEKAGIIKPRMPVVSAPQQPAAAEVIRARAEECKAPLQFVNEPYKRSPIALRGEHQKLNAALAIAALKLDGFKPSSLKDAMKGEKELTKIRIDDSAIARGLISVEWPARFQLWDKRTVIDGAHNPASARILAQTWREHFKDQRATLILAVLSDKDLVGICEALAPISESVLLPNIRSERALPPNELAQTLSTTTPSLPDASPARTSIIPSIADALKIARSKPNPILITGSLHFAGEVLAFLQNRPAAFEECAQ